MDLAEEGHPNIPRYNGLPKSLMTSLSRPERIVGQVALNSRWLIKNLINSCTHEVVEIIYCLHHATRLPYLWSPYLAIPEESLGTLSEE
jgi:hypothetical protein